MPSAREWTREVASVLPDRHRSRAPVCMIANTISATDVMTDRRAAGRRIYVVRHVGAHGKRQELLPSVERPRTQP